MCPPGAIVWKPIERPVKPVSSGVNIASAYPFAGFGCQYEPPESGCFTIARRLAFASILIIVTVLSLWCQFSPLAEIPKASSIYR